MVNAKYIYNKFVVIFYLYFSFYSYKLSINDSRIIILNDINMI